MKRLAVLAGLCLLALATPPANAVLAEEEKPLLQGFALPKGWWYCAGECFGVFCCEIIVKPGG